MSLDYFHVFFKWNVSKVTIGLYWFSKLLCFWLTPMNEYVLTLCRLCLSLLEDDLAYRFGISQSEVSNIVLTWITLMYREHVSELVAVKGRCHAHYS